MVTASRGKKQLKRWTLRFGVRLGGWQRPAETDDLYIP